MTWTLYALAQAPDIQRRLRAEIQTVPLPQSNPPSADYFSVVFRLPYLESVLRESLRLHSPITSTMRVASQDSVIPLEQPTLSGEKVVRLRKGDIITIPYQEMNRAPETWSADGAEFKPERWLGDGSEQRDDDDDFDEEDRFKKTEENRKEGGRKRLPGLWSNIMTFGNGNPVSGHRACIGYRFALSE